MAIKEALYPKLMKDPRFVAVETLCSVLQGESLTEALPRCSERLNENERRFAQHLLFGTLRQYDALEDRLSQLLSKPIKNSEIEVKVAQILAAYELTEMATAEYAILNNWVNLIKAMDKEWAAGLTNAILRNIQRGKLPPAKSMAGRSNLPQWFAKRIENQWGKEALEEIGTFYQLHPEMILRVNRAKNSREAYLEKLAAAGIDAVAHQFVESAIVLDQPVSVEQLPGFAEGLVSVQDASAQLAAELLEPQKGEYLLDACSAPGGKTTALLEIMPEMAGLVALDSSAERLLRVKENIERVMGSIPQFVEIEAIACQDYESEQRFDAILLDVPCSATGIMHRHPDIKRLRQASDIEKLRALQSEILNHAWTLLKEGGRLLYATCSILKDENEQQIRHFLKSHPDAKERPLMLPFGEARDVGVQILPRYFKSEESVDGFYYALLEKK
ncbi:16S rRNA (cytosine(967)-C(5))-methyltransferase RsmB [Ignatzschineria cameli]|uniref:16S rRNA (cytosine(967)-C(5))-methyltransferase n=1 Tax=Ignatzschineria cameli TaxID=2182793 RepID=A0A2U2AKH3_9GAMM|nr:16S rRNA (cytosine(967)-C(5))-methyltransferase RsmB [Ignatzschineria cameli]PWD83334.1 16S rRNA (cytosine(967)-C(5))-methyltransferase RsmB [Ignatzschineria cameli]PWD85690.1 16S rRNA (cytosine(967)-C(5))-methyltransferase RsmB [Ignatzschineria cameli]PWD88360.1 16S rRNA (cytosine(967)-C(5))-methyltransferase RsmB [Ignatzschineria cameli]PWD88819.1 16S rRNA (cytosine(967)-C(5))-methyltransferase RsmB [Ignatzschineria cameli]PWD89326.1 16S rRNA (cytosine(967)-C(5))-methyltransferase RsmB [I